MNEKDLARFMSKVAKTETCWLWTAAIDDAGYGRFGLHSKNRRAYRVSYEHFVGPVPNGMQVCHSCDAGLAPGDVSYRRCVNPAHLWLGTARENVQDMIAKGRRVCAPASGERHGSRTKLWSRARGERAGGARLTTDAVLAIVEKARCGQSLKSIGRDFGVADTTIASIVKGKAWRHVTGLVSHG